MSKRVSVNTKGRSESVCGMCERFLQVINLVAKRASDGATVEIAYCDDCANELATVLIQSVASTRGSGT